MRITNRTLSVFSFTDNLIYNKKTLFFLFNTDTKDNCIYNDYFVSIAENKFALKTNYEIAGENIDIDSGVLNTIPINLSNYKEAEIVIE